jgi:hypothetical protein
MLWIAIWLTPSIIGTWHFVQKRTASPFSVWPIARIQRLPKRVGLSCCYMLLHCYTAVRCEGIMS